MTFLFHVLGYKINIFYLKKISNLKCLISEKSFKFIGRIFAKFTHGWVELRFSYSFTAGSSPPVLKALNKCLILRSLVFRQILKGFLTWNIIHLFSFLVSMFFDLYVIFVMCTLGTVNQRHNCMILGTLLRLWYSNWNGRAKPFQISSKGSAPIFSNKNFL